jgi:hypothetical protein
MVETMQFVRPRRIKLDEEVTNNINESKEKDTHHKRISSKISCFYPRESDIPD